MNFSILVLCQNLVQLPSSQILLYCDPISALQSAAAGHPCSWWTLSIWWRCLCFKLIHHRNPVKLTHFILASLLLGRIFYFQTFRVPQTAPVCFLFFCFFSWGGGRASTLFSICFPLDFCLLRSLKKHTHTHTTPPKVESAILFKRLKSNRIILKCHITGYTKAPSSCVRVLASTLWERWERTFHAKFEGLEKKWSMRKESSLQWLHPHWRVHQKLKKRNKKVTYIQFRTG